MVTRVDSIWLAAAPVDIRAGTATALAWVVEVFRAAQRHCAYLYANRRGNRMHSPCSTQVLRTARHQQESDRRTDPVLHAGLYDVEREIRDLNRTAGVRQEQAAPTMDALHAWMIAQRDLVPEGLAITRALDYSLPRWAALTRLLSDDVLSVGNHTENKTTLVA